MKLLCLLALRILATPGQGGVYGDYQEDPKVFLKIVTALESSQELSSSKHDGGNNSYHLVSAKFLGTVVRDAKKFTLAYAFFVRSSPRGGEYPPARGHHFIAVLDPEWKIASHGEVDMGDYYMEGTKLFHRDDPTQEGRVVADFASTEPLIRHGGYADLMPYPFPDRISDEEWESGNFDRKTK